MRFVILDHKPHVTESATESSSARTNERHFDLMFEVEVGGKLKTIAAATLPENAADEVGAESLPDHRSEYLTYEGKLTENRGTVSRFAWGTWTGQLAVSAQLIFDKASANFPGELWELRFDTNQKKLLRIR